MIEEKKQVAHRLSKKITIYMIILAPFMIPATLITLLNIGDMTSSLPKSEFIAQLTSLIRQYSLVHLAGMLISLLLIPVFMLQAKLARLGFQQDWGQLAEIPEEEINAKVKSFYAGAGLMFALATESLVRFFT